MHRIFLVIGIDTPRYRHTQINCYGIWNFGFRSHFRKFKGLIGSKLKFTFLYGYIGRILTIKSGTRSRLTPLRKRFDTRILIKCVTSHQLRHGGCETNCKLYHSNRHIEQHSVMHFFWCYGWPSSKGAMPKNWISIVARTSVRGLPANVLVIVYSFETQSRYSTHRTVHRTWIRCTESVPIARIFCTRWLQFTVDLFVTGVRKLVGPSME